MAQSSVMKSGDSTYSYTKNSTMQRNAANAANEVIKEALNKCLNLKTLLSRSTTFAIADLGCSIGPNTLFAMQTLIETIELQKHPSQNLEFQILLNDQTSNDFNTLFASLPSNKKYFAAGVPGSFYDRLFPSSSIHIAYSSYSLHWLSKLPTELQIKDSPAWNAGKIHYTGASDAVVKAYADQFEEDMERFLRAREKEITPGGIVIILMPGVPDGVVTHGIGVSFTFIESILMDMVKEGLLEQGLIDSFNIPHMYPCVREMRRLVDKNGCFEIVKIELRSGMTDGGANMDLESAILHLRAFSEGTIVNHFGNEIVDQLFTRAIRQKLRLPQMLHSSGITDIAGQLFAVLKRRSY